MANKNKRYTREFSYTKPIMYQGEAYPSADSVISDEYGNKNSGQIFSDAYGQYYTKDRDNNVFPVMPVENLDEVTVTAPRKRDNLSEAFSRFLTLGNDNTQVNNLPHREYNTSLKTNAERGAREHALWDKEHPNLSAWRDAATAVPFAVAATPFALGTGQGLLGTTAGQAAKHGIAAIMENPYVAGINDAIGLGFAGKGAYDVSQGKFTPETAMDFLGLYPAAKSLTGLAKSKRITEQAPFISELDWSPEGWFGKYRPHEYDATDIAALESHIPEYHQIEQQTKANGTWLKMPDGSTWKGDPRGWVMSQSKNVRNKYRDEVLHHGEDTYFDDMSFYQDEEGNNITGEVLGERPLWTSTNPRVASTYGKDVYPFVIPKNADIKTVADAEGRSFSEVIEGTNIDTDKLVYPNLTEDNVVRINNVVDPGKDTPLPSSKDALPNETVPEYFKRKYIGDDLVLGQNVIRKSLYGNNGNFDLGNFNIFKTLVPLGVGISSSSLYNQQNR